MTGKHTPRQPAPPWLKAWYAFLFFLAAVSIVVQLIHHG